MYQHLRIQLILLPNWAYLHRASLELRDQRLRVEGVIRQQVRGGLGEMPEDEHDAHGRVLVKNKELGDLREASPSSYFSIYLSITKRECVETRIHSYPRTAPRARSSS